MFIYKITNKINGKIYIGQTIKKIEYRWSGHCWNQSGCTYLKHAIQKYGRENFTIEEIDGANSQSELNYLEKHYMYKFDSLAPNGYNLIEGGMERHHRDSIVRMSKKVVDIKTNKIWDTVKDCAEELNINYDSLRNMLNGANCNSTNLRYLGQEELVKKHKRNKYFRKIINTETGCIYNSLTEACDKEGINYPTLSRCLSGSRKNNTSLKYLNEVA